jgi:hypothetical protein
MPNNHRHGAIQERLDGGEPLCTGNNRLGKAIDRLVQHLLAE